MHLFNRSNFILHSEHNNFHGLLLLARNSIYIAKHAICYCLSICLSHRWISQ